VGKWPLTGTARVQLEARVLDVSLGGARLQVPTPFDVGTIGDFAIPLDGHVMWVQAEVKRCLPAADAFEVAVEFVGVHPDDQRKLRDYLDRQH
jgi:PilZ domain-containing protein